MVAIRAASEWIDTDIYLIERSGNFGPGLAYTPGSHHFVLNVPAGKMGAYAEDPGHFFKWLREKENIWRSLDPSFKNVSFEETDFVPRLVYGAYLKDLLVNIPDVAKKHGNNIFFLHDTVKKIAPANSSFSSLLVVTEDGKDILADAVILAVGNSYSKLYHTPSENIFSSPYDQSFLGRSWKNTDHIILLGAGLSMVDAVWYLSQNKYKGKITVVSRNALKPFPHAAGSYSVDAPFDEKDKPDKPSLLIKSLRDAILKAYKTNIPWQAVIDSLRPFSNKLWTSLSVQQQRKIWRVLSWWNVARHRIPAFADDAINSMIDSGQLSIQKGCIKFVHDSNEGVGIRFEDGSTLKGTAAIQCMGFDYSVSTLQSIFPDMPVIQSHWTGNAGMREDAPYALSDEYPLYGIGPLFFGHYIESTAIPDIRHQAKELVSQLRV